MSFVKTSNGIRGTVIEGWDFAIFPGQVDKVIKKPYGCDVVIEDTVLSLNDSYDYVNAVLMSYKNKGA